MFELCGVDKRMKKPSRREAHLAFLLGCATTIAVVLSFALASNLSSTQTAPATIPPAINKNVSNLGQIQMNNCLLQLSNVRDIKLYSQNDEDGALLQGLR